MTSPREAGVPRASSSLLRTEHLKSHEKPITLSTMLNTTNSFREMYEAGAEMGDVYGPSWYTIGITVMAAYMREYTSVAERMTYETV
jgi:hypothetical protein